MTYSASIVPGRYSAQAVASNLSIPEHDYVSCTYTGSNLTGAVFKFGGASGITVATLVLTYDGSNNLLTVTKS
jgi:hypothetical protein